MAPKKGKGAKKAAAKPTTTNTTGTGATPTDVPVTDFEIELQKEKDAYDLAEKYGYDDQWKFCASPDLEHDEFKHLKGLADQVFEYMRQEAGKKKATKIRKQTQNKEPEGELWEIESETDTDAQTGTATRPNGVRIRVVRHGFRTLYERAFGNSPIIEPYHVDKSVLIPPKDEDPLDTETLIFCSNETRHLFEGDSKLAEVRLPAEYSRKHYENTRGYTWRHDVDDYYSYVQPAAIQKYIVPWLRKMEQIKTNGGKFNMEGKVNIKDGSGLLPQIEIPRGPDQMEDRIHVYNSMLHLGILKYFQEPLIAELCDDVYNNKIKDSHLELLDITIGRFNSQAVAVLDPVLCCFTGAFNKRVRKERLLIQPNPANPDGSVSSGTLKYGHLKVPRRLGETPGPNDTPIIGPGLPVLGHCLRHWSLVDEKGDRTGTGYPLDYFESPRPDIRHPNRPKSPDPLRFVKHLGNGAGRKRKACECENCVEHGPKKVSKQ